MARLDGIWNADDGGLYFMRQVDDVVWWLGLSDAFDFHRGTTFADVFQGRLDLRTDTIAGDWIDVPRGATTCGGTLHLQVIGCLARRTAATATCRHLPKLP